MQAKIEKSIDGKLRLSIELSLNGSSLEQEEQLAAVLNELGLLGTAEILSSFDTNGESISVGGVVYSSKKKKGLKEVQCPYGKVDVSHYIYQSNKGGKTYVPVWVGSQMIGDNTPRLSKMLSWKYAVMSGNNVCKDMKENHLVSFSKGFVQTSVEAVGELFSEHEHSWTYDLPEDIGEVSHISISRDGAHMPMSPSGWREAMCGSISFYGADGQRLHTIYKACAPQHGTQIFQSLMDSEMAEVKRRYPNAIYLGIADGAKANWKQLSTYADIHILDFFHVTEYVHQAAKIFQPTDINARTTWTNETCHTLKHHKKGAKKILNQLKKAKKAANNPQQAKELQVIITYFSNHLLQMDYATFIQKGYPIGSGIIEAACKTLVKQRFCASAMKWTIHISDQLLLLRGLVLTKGRWQKAWLNFNKIIA